MKMMERFCFVLCCVFIVNSAFGGMIAHYKLDDNWVGDSYDISPSPMVENRVGPDAVADRHFEIDPNEAMFGKSAKSGLLSSSYNGATADSACRLPLSGDFTISAWGYVIENTTYNTLVSQYLSGDSGRTALYLSAGTSSPTKARLFLSGKWIYGTSQMDDGNWHHIVATRDGTEARLYVDGSQEAYLDYDFADVYDGDMIIGGMPSVACKAGVDDISIWDEALSATEIAYIYEQGNTYGKSIDEALKAQFDPARPEVGEGSSANFTVVLDAQPTANVTVYLEPTELDLGSGYGTEISKTFTSSDWYIPQTITVTAPNDTVVYPTKRIDKVAVSLSSSDPNFNNAFTDDVYITVVDDEKYLVIIDGNSLEVSEEGPTSDLFSVNLGVSPSGTVVVDITTDGEVTVWPEQLTFDSSNYDIPNNVTVTAVDDPNIEDVPHIGIVTLTVEVGGSVVEFFGQELSVIVNENDCGAWGYLDGDVNRDCTVDFTDFGALAGNWISCTNPADPNCEDAREEELPGY
jgi:hypothetical protein